MKPVVRVAFEMFGPLADDRCYCLKVPAVLGGKFGPENLATISRLEAIGFAGYLGQQIKDLPDGAKIQIKLAR